MLDLASGLGGIGVMVKDGKARGRGVLVAAALAAPLGALVGGCPPTTVEMCADGYVLDATGTCVPDGVTDAGPRDAAIDAGPVDAPTDAGPCSRCPAERPVCVMDTCVECAASTDCADDTDHPLCNPMTNTCVECLGATDCDAATPVCNANVCVECAASTDCATPAASRCDTTTRTCGGCTADADCTRFAATPVCDESRGACVACTGDTEAARCGGNSCRRSDGTCTATAVGSRAVCQSCMADSECAAGRRCVPLSFGGQDLGGFCLYEASGGCGNTDATRRPYSTTAMATSIDGVEDMFCMPPAGTTCEAVLETRSLACMTAADCGVEGLDDGYCPTSGPGVGLCSYVCGGAIDCGPTLTCLDSHCRTP